MDRTEYIDWTKKSDLLINIQTILFVIIGLKVLVAWGILGSLGKDLQSYTDNPVNGLAILGALFGSLLIF